MTRRLLRGWPDQSPAMTTRDGFDATRRLAQVVAILERDSHGPRPENFLVDKFQGAGYPLWTVVDLSRPACGHVKEALKGREF